MPTYRYLAADAAGRTEKGRIEADSEALARQALRARGLLPLSLGPVPLRGLPAAFSLGRRITDAELGWMTRQLASLLAARLPLEAALSATLEQAEQRHVARAIELVRDRIRGGQRLADALAGQPRSFPEIYRALVEAGERSGDLAQVMERLADHIESRGALRGKILTAFIYPAIVSLVSIGVVIFLLSYVVPQVTGAFQQAHQALPLLTRAMLAGSAFARDWGAATLAVLAGLLLAWRLRLRDPRARLEWHARLLRMPLLGRYLLGMDAARFAATLEILVASGVPLLDALDATIRTLRNDRMRAAVAAAAARVREGSPLAQALQAQRVFPPLLIHLIGSGERTGTLPAMLARAAHTLSAELERRALATTALLEPLMILVMGGIVLLIVLAVMLPIIEINQMIR